MFFYWIGGENRVTLSGFDLDFRFPDALVLQAIHDLVIGIDHQMERIIPQRDAVYLRVSVGHEEFLQVQSPLLQPAKEDGNFP